MSSRWIRATLRKKPEGTRDSTVFVNLDTAGLIYPGKDGGSYVWFLADPRDEETARRKPWDGYIDVLESPEELLGITNADRT